MFFYNAAERVGIKHRTWQVLIGGVDEVDNIPGDYDSGGNTVRRTGSYKAG